MQEQKVIEFFQTIGNHLYRLSPKVGLFYEIVSKFCEVEQTECFDRGKVIAGIDWLDVFLHC